VRLGSNPRLSGGHHVVINHRSAPRFRYPAAVEDAQRAVRFVRFHAKEYGINAERLGAVGSSSGAPLAALLGVLDGTGTAADPDPVNRVSARVQSVVASATPTDLMRDANDFVVSFMGSCVQLVGRHCRNRPR
jgi:acetyl esterase/lipase